MATHSSILARIIPRREEEPGGYRPWGHKESDTTEATEYAYILYCTTSKLPRLTEKVKKKNLEKSTFQRQVKKYFSV